MKAEALFRIYGVSSHAQKLKKLLRSFGIDEGLQTPGIGEQADQREYLLVVSLMIRGNKGDDIVHGIVFFMVEGDRGGQPHDAGVKIGIQIRRNGMG